MLLALRLAATLLHAALMFGLAPLLMGLLESLRARLLGRPGPPLLQPYRDLRKWLAKTPLLPDTATELYKVWPYAAFAAAAGGVLLVPGFTLDLATAPYGDFVTLAGLLALSRAARTLAGMETGFGFGGAAAARQMLPGIVAEAAFLAAMLVYALGTGAATIDGIAEQDRAGAEAAMLPWLALAAIAAVALAENGRMPADDPQARQEAAMAAPALALEYSGRYLALLQAAACLRLMFWCSLIGTLLLPGTLAEAGRVLSWVPGLLAWGVKLAVLAAALAVLEVSVARLRPPRLAECLGGALLLGLVAAMLLYVTGHPAG